jgi:hypothetical protein
VVYESHCEERRETMRAIQQSGWMVIAALLATCGCARATLRTELHGDGSWTRVERFVADNESALQDTFDLPTGAGWMTLPAEEKGDVIHTARRTLREGQTLRRDLVVAGDETDAMEQRLTSEVTVRRDGEHGWEYREVLRWHGPRPKPFLDCEQELRRLLREGLPDRLAKEEVLQDLPRQTLRDGWRILLGPGEGWQSGLIHEEFGVRQMQRKLAHAIDRRLVGEFGRRLSHEERQALVRKLVPVVPFNFGADDKENEGWFDENDEASVPLMFAVKMPGRLVATNGEYDPVAGEVLWGLAAAAPALEEVVLTATSETRPPPDRQERSSPLPQRQPDTVGERGRTPAR